MPTTFLSNYINMERSKFLTGMPLIQNQIIAMLMKRILSIFRSYITYIIALFLPVVFLIFAIVVGRAKITTELPTLEITLASYREPVTLYDKNETEFCNFYVNSIQYEKFNTMKVDNISATMLKLTTENPANVRQRYLVGASFEGVQDIIINNAEPISLPVINAWFNNDPYHTAPLALGLVLNSVYQKLLNASHSIKFINHPLPYTAKSQISQLLQLNNMGFQMSFHIGFSMSFVTPIFILFYIRERVCKSKHLQFVSGVRVLVFWCTNLFCDLLVYIIISVAVIITLAAFQEDGFASSSDLGRIFVILLYFGVAIIPLMYLASYLFEVPSTGFVRMSLFGLFTGIAFFLTVQLLSNPVLDLEYVANRLHWVFLVFPHYSLCSGVQESYTLYATNKVCDRIYELCVTSGQQNCTEAPCLTANYCCDIDQEYYKWEKGGIGRNIFYSYFTALIIFAVVLAKEYRVFASISYMIKSRMGGKFPQDVPDEDSDVSAEKTHIRNVPNNELFKEYTLVLKDVTKYYGKFLAVNGTCLGVKKNECFGLLGINGAGKTTTFKMMTGDVKITYGEAWVQGYSVKNQMKSVQKLIGYCPQFDAVLNDLTARETLTMFCLIRGIPYSKTRYVGEKLSRDFDFYQHLDKKVKALSGGNKRKLSTALALVGDPEIIYLDEPTTGMDPATKRFLWNVLCKVRDSGKCLVLTSHSMEECEALCTRLAIMVNGNFKCLGSTQHLKNKFSEGYTITIKLKKQDGDKDNIDTENIERYIREHFPSSHLREKHQEMLTYYIPEKNLSWSTMFGILEDGKNRFDIEDYTLGQTSLEQVFLSFTKYSES